MPFSRACIDLATKAASEILSKQEVLDAFKSVEDYRDSLPRGDGGEVALRQWGADSAQRERLKAAADRRDTARNVILKDKLFQKMDVLQRGGLRPSDSMLAEVEGSQHAIAGSRESIASDHVANLKRYFGGMTNEFTKDAPHLVHLMDDASLDKDVERELIEMRDNGKPGITGNKDAIYMARTFAKYMELGRTDNGALGGRITKMDGYDGPQTHDPALMIAGENAKQRWVGLVATKIDIPKTFPEGLSAEKIIDVLGKIYDRIITDVPSEVSAAEKGAYSGPGRITSSLEASRVLHFKDAESASAYRQAYGYSNTMQGMIAHIDRLARVNAVMKHLGTNPEVMLKSVAEKMRRQVMEATEVPAGTRYGMIRKYTPSLEEWKNTEAGLIDTQHGVLRHAIDIQTGAAGTPKNVTTAKIFRGIRATQTAAKIGNSIWSLTTDIPLTAASAQFRGGSFFKALTDQFGGMFGANNTQGAKEVASLFREGFEGVINSVNSPFAGVGDHLDGATAKMMVQFLKWSGHSWWMNRGRDTIGQSLAAEMGMRSDTEYSDLPKQYRSVLGMNGIDQTRWDIMRKSGLTADNGRNYITPDRILELPDSAFSKLTQDKIAAAGGDQTKIDAINADARRDVQLSMLRFVGDETRHSIMSTDARAQRWMSRPFGLGDRPGTLGGEIVRSVMQFKSFPLSFMSGVGGRALHGFAPEDRMQINPFQPGFQVGEQGKHIGSLLAGMTIAGYMAMTMKDVTKGYWPPRNPADPRTMLAAFQQGGGLGIYGDFLFGGQNRFGGNAAETVLGPLPGTAAQLWGDVQGIRDYYTSGGVTPTGQEKKFPLSNLFSNVVAQLPFANMHFLKPALDYLFLNSLREAISPGYLRKQADTRLKEYGQTPLWPQQANPGMPQAVRSALHWR